MGRLQQTVLNWTLDVSLWCFFPCMHCCVLQAPSSFSVISLARFNGVLSSCSLCSLQGVMGKVCVIRVCRGVLYFCVSVKRPFYVQLTKIKRFNLSEWFIWVDSVKLCERKECVVWKLMNVIHKPQEEGLTKHWQKCCHFWVNLRRRTLAPFSRFYTAVT